MHAWVFHDLGGRARPGCPQTLRLCLDQQACENTGVWPSTTLRKRLPVKPS